MEENDAAVKYSKLYCKYGLDVYLSRINKNSAEYDENNIYA